MPSTAISTCWKIQLHRIEVSVEEAEYHGFRLVVPGVSGTHTSLRLRGILSLSRTLCDGNYQLRDGRSELFEEKRSKERVIDIVRASSSLPFVCPITYVDNIPMLDGGIVDSIPLMRARQDGFTNNVVVLTRNHGYRKEIQGTKVPPFIYKKYPLLREAINRRSIVYNQQLEQVERMEAAGEIVVIRPQKPVVVDRIERDIKKLTELYEEGYRCAEQFAFRF